MAGEYFSPAAGIILTATGVRFILMTLIEMESRDYWINGMFALPFLVTGLLFLAAWRKALQLNAAEISHPEESVLS